mgnify:CR=1 FL=1
MIKVIISGCNGKMGRVLAQLIEKQKDMEVVAGFDPNTDAYAQPFPVYRSPSLCKTKADVIIDFSHHSALPDILNFCTEQKIPLVLATTGLGEKDMQSVRDASEIIPIFQSANMSVGINVMIELAQKSAQAFGDRFDIEIIEKHHNQKLDSPSGTAYMIANAINKVFNDQKEFVYGRHGKSDKRKSEDLGIHAIRGGTIAGEHTVIFAGEDEILEIKHTALSKNIFALGAIEAAKFISSREKGLYNMDDILK